MKITCSIHALIIVLIFLSKSTYSVENCSNINLYNSSLILNKMPIVDQEKFGSLGICYAAAGTQLANFALEKKKSLQRIHPIWLAYVYKNGKKNNSLNSGGIKWSLDKLQSSYNCPYDIVEDILQKLKNNFKYLLIKNGVAATSVIDIMNDDFADQLVKIFDLVEKIYDTIIISDKNNIQDINTPYSTDHEIIERKHIVTPHLSKSLIKNKLKNLNNEICYSLNKYGQCSVDSEKVFDSLIDLILNTISTFKNVSVIGDTIFIKNLSQVDFVKNLLEPYCRAFEDNKLSFDISRSFFNQETFANKTLLSGYPVGLSFDLHSIYSSYKSFSMHSLLIVGSRIKNNSCQYLLRNSWGDKVSSQLNKEECVCIVNDELQDNCSYLSLNNQSALGSAKILGCWYSRDQIFKGSNYLTIMESVR